MRQLSLATRLGYRSDDRLLIVNCDDLSVSAGANAATFQAMTRGIATSATLMVPCPKARDAADTFKGLPVGVHLTLTSEYRDYRGPGLTDRASLRDADGFLPATTKAALGRLIADDARVECRAQIETALSWGVDATHLDTHMNVLEGRADLLEVYLGLASELRLPVRVLRRTDGTSEDFHAPERAAARGVLCNEHMIYPWPRPTRDVLFAEIPKLPLGVSEIFAHPVLDSAEQRTYDPNYADLRVDDAKGLTDPAVAALLDRHNVKRISYRELRDLQRGT
ncbi:MAG: ChbG/HpnK family deacetylase [Alphaproteobacteria bacterium]|nr:ChbG/HpnK family deacetylase [Alphaproteobacteria bacterium]